MDGTSQPRTAYGIGLISDRGNESVAKCTFVLKKVSAARVLRKRTLPLADLYERLCNLRDNGGFWTQL